MGSHRNLLLAILTIIAMVSVTVAEKRVMAHWSFDSLTENVFSDITGNGYDAVGSGDLFGITSDGVLGNALECAGVANETTFDSYDIKVPGSIDDFYLSQFSIEAWVYPGEDLNNPGSFYNQKALFELLTCGMESSGITGGYSLKINYDGKPFLCWSSDPPGHWNEVKADLVMQPNQWYHLVGTFGEDTAKLYVNGQLAAATQHTGTYAPASNTARIACEIQSLNDSTSRTRQFFNGKIDEVKLYNYALGTEEITDAYNELKPVDEQPDTPMVMAFWNFDSTEGTKYFDVTGNGYDAVGTGDAFGIIDDGISGKALECIGPLGESNLDVYDIEVPGTASSFYLKEFTIEAWAYSYVNLDNPASFYNQKAIFELLTCGMESSGITGGYSLKINYDGKPFLCWSSDPPGHWNEVKADLVMYPNQWYHLVGTFGEDTAKLYVNGQLVAATKHTGAYAPVTNAARIGCEYQSINNSTSRTRQFFNGKIDEVKLYNYSLNSEEIATTYEKLKPEDEQPFEINFGMKTVYANPGDTVWMPIYLTNYEDWSFSSAQFVIKINPSQLSLIDISSDSGMVKNWMLDWNKTFADSILVGMAGTAATSIRYGEGEFVRCQFVVGKSVDYNETCIIRMEEVNIDEKHNLISASVIPGKIITSVPDVYYGDVNGDGVVTVSDVQAILSYVVGEIVLPDNDNYPSFTTTVADVSGNNVISSYDAALVLQYSLGMMADFPAQHAKVLSKSLVSSQKQEKKTDLTVSLASMVSDQNVNFKLQGNNLSGFIAGEVALKYPETIDSELIDKIDISTPLPSAGVFYKIDKQNRLIKLAITTSNDIAGDESTDLAIITLPQNSMEQLSGTFTVERALLNEGQIIANVTNGGVVNMIQPAGKSIGKHVSPISYRNGILHINHILKPVRVQIFSINGKLLENKIIGKSSSQSIVIDMNKHCRGVYFYRVIFANAKNVIGSLAVQK